MSASDRSARRPDRIRAGVEGLVRRFQLPPTTIERLTALATIVVEDPVAPTTVRNPDAVVRDHLADSLVALELEEVRSAGTLVDLGSGAGFPGLALAIALPRARVGLIESNRRKCEFIARAIERTGAANASVFNARVETWSDWTSTVDVVTARAVAPLAVLAEYAAPLLRPGGSLVAWRGRRDLETESAAARAAAELGLRPRDPIAVTPYPAAKHRHLHVMVKVAETPERFPRRPGVAAKRPLGGV